MQSTISVNYYFVCLLYINTIQNKTTLNSIEKLVFFYSKQSIGYS